jgi:dihydrolipoamide dehydrogenase
MYPAFYQVSNVSLNLDKMMKQKEKTVVSLTRGIEHLFKQNKVNYVKGHGKILNPTEVAVYDGESVKHTIKTKNILIATGSEPTAFAGLNVASSD